LIAARGKLKVERSALASLRTALTAYAVVDSD
jgi:hypothetical protein